MSARRPTLAVFGGSFDPPHLGHALMPSYLFARGLCDAVVLAPCYAHALGKELTDFDRRVAMLVSAIGAYPTERVWVSEIEQELSLGAANPEPQPSYALTLLKALAQRYPQYSLRLVVGTDITSTGETDKWHRWDQIEREFSPIVVPRAGFCPAGHAVLPDIRSRHIRASLASGEDRQFLDYALPASVLRLLTQPCAGAVWIVGSGHASTHVAAKLRRSDPHFEVKVLSARALLDDPHAALSEVDVQKPPRGIWILAKDHATNDLAAALVEAGLSTQVPMLHGGGSARSEDALAAWREAGGAVGTLHPICSLRHEQARSHIDRSSWGIEGDERARELAREFIADAPFVDLQGLDVTQRRAYHAACALVANHIAVLVGEGRNVLSGLCPQSQGHLWATVDTLVRSAVDNLMTLGIPDGVSGPVARGEMEVVRAHAQALGGESGALYRQLSERLAALLGSMRT